ncbi:MAG: tRNA wyosine derivatives biosynthesis protein Taw2 [Candidatus Methanofastidiosum methylothiophilum]|uniref:tRNA wyosine derivatives biosynthesis protein Taw2 n=1 Tax=Candidatus Methanofastidiosum methylothiophilum TaxID=1705564 RepID=A0A150IM95_9EURY|nr:MAG: tRNA wyosine derivatives biosynthesis protein Taw2 [Candidatus Methanofastidiosum methylthiophilus]KYC48779.1 MAG: tRNA wyosine derivatives biosynthesis protein Taw2 [Candidatus Methanofastidiosum methylthiophilus]KYC51427.1 MAG: tRNA wyosine derivatives biosynthesis protein Taw2 [Candidatus Methanofastidiosum methylthiophilus]
MYFGLMFYVEDRKIKKLREQLMTKISGDDIKKIMKGYEQLGDIIILVIPEEYKQLKDFIGRCFYESFKCKAVLEKGLVSGEFRIPHYQIIIGDSFVTIHKENGILYKIDLSKVMFSSGNIAERIRMAHISAPDEVVIDMFSGIGYFTLPIAKYGKSKVWALEKNPNSYDLLLDNIALNNLEGRVTAVNTDCLDFNPNFKADRIIMGYFSDDEKFLLKALDMIKDGGIIHYHNTVPEKVELNFKSHIEKILSKKGKHLESISYRKIKKYSPGVWHVVFDFKVI